MVCRHEESTVTVNSFTLDSVFFFQPNQIIDTYRQFREFDFSRGVVSVFQGCPTMQRLAAVNGLVALVGSESYLIQVRNAHISCFVIKKKAACVIDKLSRVPQK